MGKKLFNLFLDSLSGAVCKSIDVYYTIYNTLRPAYYKAVKKDPPTDIMYSRDGDHFIM